MRSREWLERPAGLRDYLPREAARRRRVEETLCSGFAAWGYLPVETPALEYAETFSKGLHREEQEQLLRLFDFEGRTLALRPEMTTPVARLVSTVMADEPLPLRLYYAARTYRAGTGHRKGPAEVTQVGVELIGDPTVDADAEVVALVVQGLQGLGLEGFRLAVGHMGYVHALLSRTPDPLREELRAALLARDRVRYDTALRRAPPDPALAESLWKLPRARGGTEALPKIGKSGAQGPEQTAVLELRQFLDALGAHGVLDRVRLDLGLYLDHEYYTGMVVEGYAEDLGQPICFGGRYDGLLSRFGREAPATGCALDVERLMAVLKDPPARFPRVVLRYSAESRCEAIGFARRLRANGWVVTAQREGSQERPGPPSSAFDGGRDLYGRFAPGGEFLTSERELETAYEVFRAEVSREKGTVRRPGGDFFGC